MNSLSTSSSCYAWRRDWRSGTSKSLQTCFSVSSKRTSRSLCTELEIDWLMSSSRCRWSPRKSFREDIPTTTTSLLTRLFQRTTQSMPSIVRCSLNPPDTWPTIDMNRSGQTWGDRYGQKYARTTKLWSHSLTNQNLSGSSLTLLLSTTHGSERLSLALKRSGSF